ncbi:hypothetical protein A4X13_0g4769 [Tilletia indica]|uniref:Uncharacterized protein n=1 Tax=Tilletia indica TaxID=43049 RepID=A0A177TAU3_9BASI|nr:hypothetical protein A4X13_0g4769 [Tilletia indica]
MAPSSPTQAPKNAKWPTHLSLSAELILGESVSKDNVNEVSTSMYTHDGREQSLTLNVWGRDAPEQGTYLVTNVPFATHPLRLGVGDSAEMRLVPDEFDGIEPGSATLPPTFVFLAGIGVIVESDANRKGCSVSGFTYLNKKHGWQKWSLRLEFEDTARWAAWTVPGVRTLVTFDAVLVKQDFDGQYQCYIRRITSLSDADRSLLTALNVGSPGGGDRAERLRQAREAKRLFMEKKNNSDGKEHVGQSSNSRIGDSDTNATPERHTDDTPSTPITRKGRPTNEKVDKKGKGKQATRPSKRAAREDSPDGQDTDEEDGSVEVVEVEDIPGDKHEDDDEPSPPARKIRRTASK